MWSKMQLEVMIILLSMEIIHTTYTMSPNPTTQANKLIQDICETFDNNDRPQQEEDQHWMILCKELFRSKRDNEEEEETDNGQDRPMVIQTRNADADVKIRIGGIRRVPSGIRTPVSRGGTRTSPSVSQYRSASRGVSIPRPAGSLWSRSRYLFLPLATRYIFRSRSSSNKYTTPSTGSVTYYYCTSNDNDANEIQCSSINGDSQCCEDTNTREVYCCGGEIPDDLKEDMNRATRMLARVFYTLTALALFMHVVMRRFHR